MPNAGTTISPNEMTSRNPPPIVPGRVDSETYRRFVDHEADYAMYLLDPKGHVASWNLGAERMKGYTADEVIGKHFSMFYPPNDVTSHKPQFVLRVAQEEGRYSEEGWRIRKAGTLFWANATLTALRDGDGHLLGFAKVTRDLTERRHAEEALKQSEERLRLLVASVKDYAIFMLDKHGRILTWNEGAQRLKGYTAEEIIGRPFTTFYTEEDRARGHPEDELRIAIQEGRYEEEGWRVRKDGTHFWANVTITALRDAKGELRGFAKVTRDLTARKRAEEEAQQRAEDYAALNRELDSFTSAVAHDLRAPLRAMMHLAEDISENTALRADASALTSLRALQSSARRMSDLIDGLLELSRSTKGALHPEPVDVSKLAEDVWKDVLQRAPGSRAKLDVQPGLHVTADARLLRALLDNLLSNAIKFSANGDSPIVHVGRSVSRGETAFYVRDNGIGFDAERARGIFEPFQRLPSAAGYEGLGIGLATVKRIVARHGGRIWAESKEGQGATFWFTLP